MTDRETDTSQRWGGFWLRLLGKPRVMRSAYDIARKNHNGDEGTAMDFCGTPSNRSDWAKSVTPLFGACPYTGRAKNRRK